MYCPNCLDCGCEYRTDHGTINGICVGCYRNLHTIMTFEGPRIRQIEIYGLDAFHEYGVRAFELLTWTFEEEENLESTWDDTLRNALGHAPVVAPPHHRFTSSGGSR